MPDPDTRVIAASTTDQRACCKRHFLGLVPSVSAGYLAAWLGNTARFWEPGRFEHGRGDAAQRRLSEIPARRCQLSQQRRQVLDKAGDEVAHIAFALPGATHSHEL